MAQAPRDENRVTALLGVSNADGTTTLPVYVDSATNRLLISGTSAISSEYTEGDTDATITGIAVMAEAAGDVLQPLSVDASNYLNVNVAAGSITVDSEFPAAAALTDNFANPTTTNVAAMNMLWDSATWDRAPGDATNGQLVNLGTNNDVTLAVLPDTAAGDLAAINAAVSGALDVSAATVTVDTELGAAVTPADGLAGADSPYILSLPLVRDRSAGDYNRLSEISETLSNAQGVQAVGNMGLFDDAAPTSSNEGEVGVFRMSSRREQYMQIRDAAGNERGANVDANNALLIQQATALDVSGATVTVDLGANNDVTTTAQVPGTGATNLGKAEDAAHTTGDTGVAVWAVRDDDPPAATSGTAGDYEPFHTDARGILWARSVPDTTDLANLGGEHVNKYYTATTPTDGIVWSPAAGKRWYVTDIFINVSAAATVTLEDDKTGGDNVVWKAELAANSGWSHSFTTPLFSGEDAADLIITVDAGDVYVMVTGYEI